MPRMTAEEIAVHIQRSGEPRSAALYRFRNWVKMGILSVRPRPRGRGRHTKFDTEQLLQAMILQTLTDALGSPATSLKPIVKQAMEEIFAAVIQRPVGGPERPFLVINRPAGPFSLNMNTVSAKDLGQQLARSNAEVHIVFNTRIMLEAVMELEEEESAAKTVPKSK